MDTYVKCSEIYCEDGVKAGYLPIAGGQFGSVAKEAPEGARILDYTGCRIIPGIFDTHNHGAMGYSVKKKYLAKEYVAEITGYIRALPALGVTAVFPTTMEGYGFSGIVEAVKQKPKGAQVLGIHSEGPYLARAGEKGKAAAPPVLCASDIEKIVEESQGLLKLFALAPELAGAKEVIRYLQGAGVTVAMAHTNGNAALARWAIEQGITVATHLGNVMTGIHHRDIGVLGACLMDGQIDCELICDGLHICNDMLAMMFRLKDKSKFMLISDGTPYSGAPTGNYYGYEADSVFTISESGSLTDQDGKICGSSVGVLQGMKNLVENLGMSLSEVWRMASLNPAKKYGFGERKGSILSGKDADFVVLGTDFSVQATFIMGEMVYQKGDWDRVYSPSFVKKNRIAEV